MHILAIESSCDDLGVSVCCDGRIKSNIVHTQKVHEDYGGVIPELAARTHLSALIPVVSEALLTARVSLQDVDAFAFTQYPGLIGSLLVGSSFIKALALVHPKPLIGVNHINAHVSANLIDWDEVAFPFLCLSVSGGHTQIIRADAHHEFQTLGSTLDDAAGEAFDKTAKLLGLGYPGGPLIDKLAKGGKARFRFAKPQSPHYDYSFSGLKTSILYFLKKEMQLDPTFIHTHQQDLCASVQQSIVDTLLDKFFKAAQDLRISRLCLAGGVAANSLLRSAFVEGCTQRQYAYHIPKLAYCTDNAAMIGINAYYQYQSKGFVPLRLSAEVGASVPL